MSQKKYRDINGFLHLKGTPISRVQVAPYLGKQIDSRGILDLDPKLQPNELYGVFRSPTELFKESTMRSFDGMPFRVGHQMLGKKDKKINKGLESVDANPVDGCFFNVRRSEDDPDYLIADIVIYTDKALRALANGTKELSLGYRCAYVPVDSYPEPEYYKGQPYLFKQQDITANHLALVPHGRAGSSVCVQDEAVEVVDGLVITCDSLPEEIQIMEENEKKAQEKLANLLRGSEEDIQNVLDYCDFTDEQKAKIKEMKKSGTSAEVEEKTDTETEVAEDSKACKKCDCTDESTPPTPPEIAKEDGVEKKGEGETIEAKAEETVEAKVDTEPTKEEKPAEGEVVEPAKQEEKPVETVETAEKVETTEVTPTDGEGAVEVKAEETVKTYTQDELDEACKKARAEGRKEGVRACRLADAVGEDAADKSEADVARAACKKIKGLEFAADAADDVAIAAIRSHLATKGDEEKAKKPTKKSTLLSVPTQDEAIIAKTQVSFNSGKFTQFLAKN